MKISRNSFQLANVEIGTIADLYHDEAFPETEDEGALFKELREAAASKHTDSNGREVMGSKPLIVEDKPFNNRIVFALKPTVGKERFAIFSQQAIKVIFDGNVGHDSPEDLSFTPINSSAAADIGSYACISGMMNGIPCVNIISKDRHRAIVIASRKQRVIAAVMDRVLNHEPRCRGLAVAADNSFINRWNVLSDKLEIIVVQVKTLDQAMNALVRYRPYLDDLNCQTQVIADFQESGTPQAGNRTRKYRRPE